MDNKYGLVALRDHCNIIARTPEGGRQNQLFTSSCRIAKLVGERALDEENARFSLERAGLKSRLPRTEVERNIDRAFATVVVRSLRPTEFDDGFLAWFAENAAAFDAWEDCPEKSFDYASGRCREHHEIGVASDWTDGECFCSYESAVASWA